jgi:hypothetical protein
MEPLCVTDPEYELYDQETPLNFEPKFKNRKNLVVLP